MADIQNYIQMNVSTNGNLTEQSSKTVLSKSGSILIALTGTNNFVGGSAIALLAVCAPFVSPALRRICLPYVPATTAQVENVLTALKGRRGNLIDLGSGDGRIVLAAAAAGFKSAGVELNPWLVLYSRFSAIQQGFRQQTAFYRCDLWKFSLKPYKNIVIFGVEQMMEELEEKVSQEVETGTYVVACRFPLPRKSPDLTIGSGVDKVWLYKFDT